MVQTKTSFLPVSAKHYLGFQMWIEEKSFLCLFLITVPTRKQRGLVPACLSQLSKYKSECLQGALLYGQMCQF